MISRPDECDAGRLRALLEDGLSEADQAALAAHLEGCPACRHALEALAAGSRWWGEARRLIEDGPPGETRAIDPGEGDATETLAFLAPSEDPDHLGRLGRYEVVGRIGRGGMGLVLKAFDPPLNRYVAIKVLAPGLAAGATARRRFAREARAAAAIAHEHVVAIHAVDATPDGLPFLVMNYVAGRSLQERIDRSGPLEVPEIVRVAIQAARGLAAAHAQGLVHRDVKPSNILLENCVERVKLTDFGLARAADDASLTQSGVVAGTPQFMAPEQARGESVDARADLFSLGGVMYAMATGRPPFRADSTPAVLRRVCEDTPRPVREVNPEIPAWLGAIIARLLAKDPADRFASAEAVADLLEGCLAHLQRPDLHPLPTEAAALVAPDAPPRRPRRLATIAALGLLGLLTGLGATEATGVTNVAEVVATVLRIPTPCGTLVVEVDDPSVKVRIDGQELTISGEGIAEVRLSVGAHQVQALRDGLPVRDELIRISRGGKEVVRVRCEPDGAREPILDTRQPIPAAAHKPDHVWSLAFSPDGRHLAAAVQGMEGRPSSLQIWDLARREARRILQDSKTRGVAYSPDGKTIATAHFQGPAWLWDAETGRRKAAIALNPPGSNGVAFSPNGTLLALASGPRVILADPTDGRIVKPLQGHPEEILAVSFSPDGLHLAAASKDGMVDLWNLGDVLLESTLRGPRNVVEAVAFSPNGEIVASAGWDRTVHLWNVRTGQPLKDLTGHTQAVLNLAFSPDGRTLATVDGPWDGVHVVPGPSDVRLWSIPDGTLRSVVRGGHANRIWGVAFSPDGKTLATGGADGRIKLWETAPLAERGVLTVTSDGGAVSPNGATVGSGNPEVHGADDGAQASRGEALTIRGKIAQPTPPELDALVRELSWTEGLLQRLQRETRGHPDAAVALVRRWVEDLRAQFEKSVRRLEQDRLDPQPSAVLDHDNGIWSLAFSPDGQELATATKTGDAPRALRLWDLSRVRPWVRSRIVADVRSLAFSRRGTLAAGEARDMATLRNRHTGAVEFAFSGHAGQVIAVAFAPDGKMLATASLDRTVKLWDAETGHELRTLSGHEDWVLSVAVSPDGALVASAGKDGRILVWEADTGRLVMTLSGHTAGVEAVAFSNSGQWIASAGWDGTARIWRVDTGHQEHVLKLPGDRNGAMSVAFSPDGDTLAVGGSDGTLMLAAVASGRSATFRAHEGGINAVVFAPDGRRMATGSWDRTVKLWDVASLPAPPPEGPPRLGGPSGQE